jgi:hypothetical protein
MKEQIVPYTPQLHDRMPENMRRIKAADVSRVASKVNFSPEEVVEATTRKSIWRWALALLSNPFDAPQPFHDVGERVASIRSNNQLSAVRMIGVVVWRPTFRRNSSEQTSNKPNSGSKGPSRF